MKGAQLLPVVIAAVMAAVVLPVGAMGARNGV